MTLDHHFWLLQQGEQLHRDYKEFVDRNDAPVAMHDEILRYFSDTLRWIPTLNPAKSERGYGLNVYGPTVIDQIGGALFHDIFASWAHLFSLGPEYFSIQGLFSLQWPYEESEHMMAEAELHKLGEYDRLSITRDDCVERLMELARFGEQARGGQFFVLHLGI
jgi:hypothetical protein